MADQIVITEKTSQAKEVRAAVGSRYGNILPAEGHLFELLEPEDVVPAWILPRQLDALLLSGALDRITSERLMPALDRAVAAVRRSTAGPRRTTRVFSVRTAMIPAR